MTTRVTRAKAATTPVVAATTTPPDSAALDMNAGRSEDADTSQQQSPVFASDDDDRGGDRDQATTRQVARARHEIVTGPDEDDKIAPGTRINRRVIEEHQLKGPDLEKLLRNGAIELIDVEVETD